MLLDLIPLPVRIGALVAVIVGAGVAGWTVRGWIAERDIATLEKDIAQQREAAVTEARAIERQQQEVANHALRTQNETLAANAASLRADLERLRQRPARPAAGVPAAACPGRACATGADLCREDAEFLRREAARADDLRAGLVGCYEVIDGLRPSP